MKIILRAIVEWLMRYEALLHMQVDKFELEQMDRSLQNLIDRHHTLEAFQASELAHFDIDQKIKRDNFLAQQQIERLMLERELASMHHRRVSLERQIEKLTVRTTA